MVPFIAVVVAIAACLALLIALYVRIRARIVGHIKMPGLPRIGWVFAIGFALAFSLPPTDVSGQQVITTSQPQDQSFSAPFLNGTNAGNMPQFSPTNQINPGGGGTVSAFATATRGWISTLSGMATRIFFLLAIIDFAWMVIQWLMTGRENTGEFLGQWVVKLFGISVVYWLVLIHGWEISQIIIGSILTAGENIAGVATGSHVVSNTYTFEGIVSTGTALATPMFIEALIAGAIPDIAGIGFTNLALPLMYTELFGATAVLAAYILMAASLLLVWIEMYICTSLGLLMLGFSGSRWTSGFGFEKYLMMSFSIGIKMLMTYICVDLAYNIGNSLIGTTMVPGIGAIYGGFIASIMTLIVYNVPAFASSLLQGASSSAAGGAMTFSSGVAAQMAGAMQTMTQSMEAFASTLRAREEELRDEKMAALPSGSAPAPGFGSDGNMSVFTGQPVATELAADAVEGKNLDYAALGQGNQAGSPTGANEAFDRMFFGSGNNGEQGGRGNDGTDGVNAYAGLTNGMPGDQANDGSRFVDTGNGQGVLLANNGTAVTPDGSIVGANGAVREPDGTLVTSNGDVVLPDGRTVLGDDRVFDRNGRELAALDAAELKEVNATRDAALEDRKLADDARSGNVPIDDSSIAAKLTDKQETVIEQLERVREAEKFEQSAIFATAVREELMVERRTDREQVASLNGGAAGRTLEFAPPAQAPEAFRSSESASEYAERPAAFAAPAFESGVPAGSPDTTLAGSSVTNGALFNNEMGAAGPTPEFVSSSNGAEAMPGPASFAERPAAFASPAFENGVAGVSPETALTSAGPVNAMPSSDLPGGRTESGTFAAAEAIAQEPLRAERTMSAEYVERLQEQNTTPAASSLPVSEAIAFEAARGDRGAADYVERARGEQNGTEATSSFAPSTASREAEARPEPASFQPNGSNGIGSVDAFDASAANRSAEIGSRPQEAINAPSAGSLQPEAIAFEAARGDRGAADYVERARGEQNGAEAASSFAASTASREAEARPEPASFQANGSNGIGSVDAFDASAVNRSAEIGSRPQEAINAPSAGSVQPEAIAFEAARGDRGASADYVERARGEQNGAEAASASSISAPSREAEPRPESNASQNDGSNGAYAADAPAAVRSLEPESRRQEVVAPPAAAALPSAASVGYESAGGERARPAEYVEPSRGERSEATPVSTFAAPDSATKRSEESGLLSKETVMPSAASLSSSDVPTNERAEDDRVSSQSADSREIEWNNAEAAGTLTSPSESGSLPSASAEMPIIGEAPRRANEIGSRNAEPDDSASAQGVRETPRPQSSDQAATHATSIAEVNRDLTEPPKESFLSRVFGIGRQNAEPPTLREIRERTIEERTIRETRTREDATPAENALDRESEALPEDVYEPSTTAATPTTPADRRTIFDSERSTNTRDNGKKG